LVTKKRVLVAGAGGAIGRVLCRLLLADGHFVVGTTRSSARADLLRELGVEPVVVDVFDAQTLRQKIAEARVTIVIHQLTDLPQVRTPEALAEALVRNAHLREVGTRNLVEAAIAGGVTRMIVQSVAFAYAPGPRPYDETCPLNVASEDRTAAATAGDSRNEIREHKAIALDDCTCDYLDWLAKHRPVAHKRMKLAAFPARIDSSGYRIHKGCVE